MTSVTSAWSSTIVNACALLLEAAGVPIMAGVGLNFADPWGNRIQVVQYDQIQFSKTPAVLVGTGLSHLGKSAAALAELRENGLQADSG